MLVNLNTTNTTPAFGLKLSNESAYKILDVLSGNKASFKESATFLNKIKGLASDEFSVNIVKTNEYIMHNGAYNPKTSMDITYKNRVIPFEKDNIYYNRGEKLKQYCNHIIETIKLGVKKAETRAEQLNSYDEIIKASDEMITI